MYEVPSSGYTPYHFCEKRIVIVGAGIAGLSAAARLKELGFQNVKILEARDYIGGRIKTLFFDSSFIEMGAQWIHGQKGNSIYELAEKNDLVDVKAPNYMESISEWEILLKFEYKENIVNALKFLEKSIDEFDIPERNDSYIRGSLSSHLHEAFEKYLRQCKNASPNCVAERACYDWFLKLQCEMNGCNNLSDVSKSLLHKYRSCEGYQNVELKHGFSAVLNLLIRSIPSEWIVQNQKVIKIDWSLEPDVESLVKKLSASTLQNEMDHCKWYPITIHCDNDLVYVADHIIVTIPLGCLKNTAHELFMPALPSKKLKAIESVGFGVVDKIYLEFEEPFWVEPAIFNMLWFNEDFQTISENPAYQKDMKNTWFKYISRFAFVHSCPKMLCAWIVGKGAVFMETLPESQVMSECHKLLKEKLGNEDLPYPFQVIRSKWRSDPFVQGSYSYNSVACEETETSHEDLANPVLVEVNNRMYPILQFAGEATHSYHYSTVHGAYESGIREANKIYEYYHENCTQD